MYKNQLQELAQRSCFNLPSYVCIREGPDHAPRFKASVNFNGESFDSPCYCTTLRQAEHSAAEVALNTLSTRGPSRSLTAKVLDETGVYKNLLQETAHRAGLNLPVYTTVRSGPGHVPIFTCSVELAGMNFSGEPAKTKKQAEKNAAMAAWSCLKHMPNMGSSSQTNKATVNNEEQEQVVVARVLSQFKPKDESKTGRERELNQARRKMVSDYRDKNNHVKNSLQLHQWRSMGLSTDVLSSVMYPSQQHQNHFLAQLPPPTILQQPPVRSSKYPFLYSSNRSIPPVQIRSRNQVVSNTQEVPTPVEEHQKDEDEWLSGKSFVTDKSIGKDINVPNSTSVFRSRPSPQIPLPHIDTPVLDHRTQQTQIRTTPFGPPHPSMMPKSFPRIPNTGVFCAPQGVAPAVQIRSVIPVCATPPVRASPSSSLIVPTPSQAVKEASVIPLCATPPVRASPSSSSTVPTPCHAVKEVVSLPSVSDSTDHVFTPTPKEQEVITEGSLKMTKLQL